MLYYFVVGDSGSFALRFSFRTLVDVDELRSIKLPGKVVSYSENIEYFFSDCKLYITAKGKFTTVVDLREGCAVAYVVREYLQDTWLMAHHAFYPALSELLKVEGLFDIHSAALSRGGKTYLFPGKSGSGKSTTTLALLLDKFMFLSDDITFVRGVGGGMRILCFPEPVHLWKDSYDLFPEMKNVVGRDSGCGRRKQSFIVEKLFPEQQEICTLPRYMLFPVVSGGACRIEPMSGKEALAHLLPQSLIMANPDIVGKHLAVLSGIVTQSRCFRLFLGEDMNNLSAILP